MKNVMRDSIGTRVPFEEFRNNRAERYSTPEFPRYSAPEFPRHSAPAFPRYSAPDFTRQAPSVRTRYSPPVDPLFVAFRILQVMFVAMPIIAGMDTFFHVTANWDHYVSPVVPFLTHIRVHEASLLIAPFEIAVGLMVAFKPRIGAVAAMLLFATLSMNLLLTPGQLHIAFLYVCMCLNAVVLFILSRNR